MSGAGRDPFGRTLAMLPLLVRRPGVPVRDLARRAGVSERVVLRDLQRLLLCGVPPYLPDDYVAVLVEAGRVRVRFAERFRRPVPPTAREALALLLALPEPGPPGAEALRARLRRLLGTTSDLLARVRRGSSPASVRSRVAALDAAAEARRRVRLDYFSTSRDALVETTVEPCGVAERGGDLYLVARPAGSRGLRVFRVDRIRSLADAGAATGARPRDWARVPGPRGRPKRPAGEQVEVRVAPEAASWVDPREVGGRFREEPDGGLRLTFRAASLESVARWLLPLGARAEALRPPALRARLARAASDVLAAHGATAPG